MFITAYLYHYGNISVYLCMFITTCLYRYMFYVTMCRFAIMYHCVLQHVCITMSVMLQLTICRFAIMYHCVLQHVYIAVFVTTCRFSIMYYCMFISMFVMLLHVDLLSCITVLIIAVFVTIYRFAIMYHRIESRTSLVFSDRLVVERRITVCCSNPKLPHSSRCYVYAMPHCPYNLTRTVVLHSPYYLTQTVDGK
jgi:hypothetical protein